MRSVLREFGVVLLVGLLAGLSAGCGGDDNGNGDQAAPPAFGGLGGVVVAAGDDVQVRSLLAHDGWEVAAEAGRDAIEIAVQDIGEIHGHGVALGLPVNSMCSPAGGRAAAQAVIADEQVVGVIGTSCSGAGAAASELLGAAGLVMISPSNTSPSLTSDLEGNPNPNYYPGYFRLSNNDIYTGRAAAAFVHEELGLTKVGTVDIDDAYIAGLVDAFRDAFESLGGEAVATRILFDNEAGFDASLAAASGTLADAGVQGVFFPLYPAQATPLLEQLPEALRALPLVSADALLTSDFLGLDVSQGLYIAGPITTFGNSNGVTGKSEVEVKRTIETAFGDTPGSFWQHSYDAATLLLDAIRAVAEPHDGQLYIDRAALRAQVAATDGFQGLIGAVSCDAFGDCGNGSTNVYHHTDTAVTDPGALEVVYRFAP